MPQAAPRRDGGWPSRGARWSPAVGRLAVLLPVACVSAESLRRRRPAWLHDAEPIDLAVYAAITETPTPSLDPAMGALTRAADHSRLWPALSVILVATRGVRGRRAAARGLASVAVTSALANLLMKPLGRRRRPDRRRLPASRRAPMPASSGFPSGHSASAFAFATGVGSVLPYDAIPIRALAAIVAYSRVHSGVHYPPDAVARTLLGSTTARATTRLLDRQQGGCRRLMTMVQLDPSSRS